MAPPRVCRRLRQTRASVPAGPSAWPGACDGQANIRANMPVTVFRLWSRDDEYRMTAFEGRTIAPARHILGLNGVVQIDGFDLRTWFEEAVYEGLPHHVNVVEGHVLRELKQVARLLQLKWHG